METHLPLELCLPASTAVRDMALLRFVNQRHGQARLKHQGMLDLKDALRMTLAQQLAASTGLRCDQVRACCRGHQRYQVQQPSLRTIGPGQ